MKIKAKNLVKVITLLILPLVLAPQAGAAESKSRAKMSEKQRTATMKAKKESAIGFIQDAAERSSLDHVKMKQKVQAEKADRQAAWAERGTGAIEIKGSGAFAGMEYLTNPQGNEGGPGAGEVDIYDTGKDLSGLKSLKSKVELDNTDANFDAELEEVNRGIDSDLEDEKKKASMPNNPNKAATATPPNPPVKMDPAAITTTEVEDGVTKTIQSQAGKDK